MASDRRSLLTAALAALLLGAGAAGQEPTSSLSFGQQGEAFLASGEYEKALAAYREGIKSDGRDSFCGTCRESSLMFARFGEARALEFLNLHEQAVRAYFGILIDAWGSDRLVHRRIVDLYEATGQAEFLKKILDPVDAERLRREEAARGSPLTPEEMERHRPTRFIRKLLHLRDQEREGEWAPLVDLIQGTGFPYQDANWGASFMVMEASRLLALHPREAVPLLLEKLAVLKDRDALWVCYALARCGGPDALEAIRRRAMRQSNYHGLASLVYSLSLAGEPGRRTVEELRFWGKGNPGLPTVMEHYDKGGWHPDKKDPAFPPIPANLKLPTELPN